ncbi:unnamed protein product [Polarella glacialis]|uniref:Pentacotripeptide-repeat region of PRORP domain-containing protein n=1 Tax=Polarella glacialis TaxID=89957 RepID=A0A813DHJ7_POLGL|nr:unnamed protein product [Polarella glacialis]
MDACIQSLRLETALSYFAEAKEQGAGIEANRITYQSLLGVMVQRGNYKAVWQLVDEMQNNGIHSSVALSILLRGISCRSQAAELNRIVQLLDASSKAETEEKPVMDEALFASLAEACLRCGSLDLLWERTRLYSSQNVLPKLSAPICGSMITLFGQARKMERIMLLWDMIAAQEVMPTSMTLGCMV